MAKKGLLGNKKTLLDSMPQAVKMPDEPMELRIRKAKNGYTIRKSGGKLGYGGEEYIAETKEKAAELLEKHLG
jgi:hypothetical protein